MSINKGGKMEKKQSAKKQSTKSVVAHKAAPPVVVTQGTTPIAAAQMAMAAGMDIEKLEKIMELQVKWDALEAKRAFVKAMAEFKKNPPIIYKDKKVEYEHRNDDGKTGYRHASLGNVTDTINTELAKYGLAAAWKQEQKDSGITVICTITHEQGHSESTSLTAGADASGKKNAIQAIGSTITYLERYTLLALAGLATHDQDDDGGGSEPVQYIDDKQKSNIVDMIVDSGAYEDKFLKFLGASSIDTIKAGSYNQAINSLKKYKEEQDKNGGEK